jgi:hypothetical protein
VDRASTHARNSSEGTELGYLQTSIESEAGDGPKRSNNLFKRAGSARMLRSSQNLTPSPLLSIPNAVQGRAEEDAQLDATDGQAPSGGGPGYESNGVVVESPPALNCIVVSVQEEIPALPKQTSLTFPPQKL